jgi:peptidoglycan-N-acetylglucosamine deacetylase
MKRLTLTFDNGPVPGSTERVLRTLGERGLHATFFMVGRRVAEPAGRVTAQRVKDAGHAIGNHTMSHGEPLGTSRSESRVRAEIGGAHEALGDLIDGELLFRPNGGGVLGPHLLSESAVAYLTTHEYTVVTWNAVPRDWEPPSDSWVARAWDAIESQDWTVLVLHDHHVEAVRHLPAFLDAVAASAIEIRPDLPTACVPIRRGRIQWPIDCLTTARDPRDIPRETRHGPAV